MGQQWRGQRVRRQRPPERVGLPEWLDVPRPPVETVVRELIRRRPGARRVVALTAVDEGAEATLGLVVTAAAAAASWRVRLRVGRQVWWLTAGPHATELRRDALLLGHPFGFENHWDATSTVLAMYRRLLLVIDALPEDGAGRHFATIDGQRHTNLVIVPNAESAPHGAAVVTVDAALIGRAALEQFRARVDEAPAGAADRMAELGVLAPSAPVPMPLLAGLWQATTELAAPAARALCETLTRLGLIRIDNRDTVRIHPVTRRAARLELDPERLVPTYRALLDTHANQLPLTEEGTDAAWWEMATADAYLRDNLIDHMVRARRPGPARDLAGDLRWTGFRLVHDGPAAAYGDLVGAATPGPDATLKARRKAFAAAARYLDPTDPPHVVADILIDELRHHSAWREQARTMQAAADHPVLASRRSRRRGQSPVYYADLSPDGRLLAYATGGVVKWEDLSTGQVTTLLTAARRDEYVRQLEFGPDGTWLAALSSTATAGTGAEDPPYSTYLKVWDVPGGEILLQLDEGRLYSNFDSFRIGADGTWLRTVSRRGTQAWEIRTGRPLPAVPSTGELPRRGPRTEAVSPDGAWRATVDRHELRLWNIARDRPGPATRVSDYHSGMHQAIWLPDGCLLVHGSSGRHRFDVRLPTIEP